MNGLKWERLFLIAFFGNYIINNVVAGIVSLIPAGTSTGLFTPQYISYVVLAAIAVGLLTWWYFMRAPVAAWRPSWKTGLVAGISGFVISILTTFVSGIAGVLAQSGSLSQVWSVLPNFGPFLWNPSTLWLFLFWVIPATFVGWLIGMKMSKKMVTPPPSPMMGTHNV
jgi:hypothetical protein